jgi:hypothetical protein
VKPRYSPPKKNESIYGFLASYRNFKPDFSIASHSARMFHGKHKIKFGIFVFKYLAAIEKYRKIVLWLSDKNLSTRLASKLNEKRCFIISHIKTPYECYSQKVDVKRMISDEEFAFTNTNIIRYADIVDKVLAEFRDFDKLVGVQVRKTSSLLKNPNDSNY